MNLLIEDIDIADLKKITDLIRKVHGYDFRNYAMSSFKRRMLRMLKLKALTVDELLNKLKDQPSFVDEFLDELTVNVTEMFRDPGFWRVLRKEIIPGILLNHNQFKIWHAGCSSGEEVFSMAILLKQMGIHHDVTLMATDLDANILEKAKSGSYPMKNMELNEKNYIRFQETGSLKDYYKAENGRAVLDKELVANVSFRKHDLVTGETFNEFDLILCRNVMIYFNQALQNDVLKKFHGSLISNGYLAIGSKESLIWCDVARKLMMVNNEEKVYQKIKDSD